MGVPDFFFWVALASTVPPVYWYFKLFTKQIQASNWSLIKAFGPDIKWRVTLPLWSVLIRREDGQECGLQFFRRQ